MNKMSLKSLLVIWRDKETRLYFHIGNLSYDENKYFFEYTHQSKSIRKVHDAIKHGYRLHPAFVNLKQKYESEKLFPAFDRRVPSIDRVDYTKILKDLKLPPEADRMDILRKTRGIISGDPYFFEEPLCLNDNEKLTTHFYISGMRYRQLPDDWGYIVNIGDQLLIEPEKDNKHDPFAIKLKTENDLWLGYVPGIYTQAIQALSERNINVIIKVEEKRPTYAPQWWIRVSLEAVIDVDKEYVSELEGLVLYAS